MRQPTPVQDSHAVTDLLAWLARQPVADVRIEPLGLNALYYRFHGDEA